MTVRIIVEIDEGPFDLRFAHTDEYETTQSMTDRVLNLTASVESSVVAALNAKPREATPR